MHRRCRFGARKTSKLLRLLGSLWIRGNGNRPTNRRGGLPRSKRLRNEKPAALQVSFGGSSGGSERSGQFSNRVCQGCLIHAISPLRREHTRS